MTIDNTGSQGKHEFETGRVKLMGDERDKRIAIVVLSVITMIALVGLILLEALNTGSEAGFTVLSTVVGGGVGALAMSVRPTP
jgi:hypothetical protein